MSRETLLDDAIAKAKEAEDWQLVEWLRMARGGESAARWYTKKLQEEQDENDRLRNEFRKMDEWHSKELLAATDANVKLRELAAGIGHLLFSLDVDYCAACTRDGVNHPCPAHTACDGECLYKTDLRELGVYV